MAVRFGKLLDGAAMSSLTWVDGYVGDLTQSLLHRLEFPVDS